MYVCSQLLFHPAIFFHKLHEIDQTYRLFYRDGYKMLQIVWYQNKVFTVAGTNLVGLHGMLRLQKKSTTLLHEQFLGFRSQSTTRRVTCMSKLQPNTPGSAIELVRSPKHLLVDHDHFVCLYSATCRGWNTMRWIASSVSTTWAGSG